MKLFTPSTSLLPLLATSLNNSEGFRKYPSFSRDSSLIAAIYSLPLEVFSLISLSSMLGQFCSPFIVSVLPLISTQSYWTLSAPPEPPRGQARQSRQYVGQILFHLRRRYIRCVAVSFFITLGSVGLRLCGTCS